MSERRRVFGRIALGSGERALLSAGSSADKTQSSSSASQQNYATGEEQRGSRSESPLSLGADSGKICMKIQFHITIAPEDEPLIVCEASAAPPAANSVGEHIQQRLSRQNTSSTRRRQQLMALHKQSALHRNEEQMQSEDNIATRHSHSDGPARTAQAPFAGRDSGARSSTITSGMSDEATALFLARATPTSQPNPSEPMRSSQSLLRLDCDRDRDHIYFKRDGQRFGHEFTLKLAVDRTYRCLLKVRPLIALQAISMQGHQLQFADCSAARGQSLSAPSSASASSSNVSSLSRGSRLSIQNQASQVQAKAYRTNHRLSQAQTQICESVSVFQEQQKQMLRHFAASHCSSSSNSHLGGQLIYMFDWPASRFEVNKNKKRTEVQTVLKFKNGQILSLPLQVKFYEPERKQHLKWGSQLHFIDYDCSISNIGHMNVDRVQYY